MSIESAKAFCVRMMSDDEFRGKIGAAETANVITELVNAERYDFSKNDLRKVISEIIGKNIEPEELTAMVCEVYESEIKAQGGTGSAQAVADWLNSLA
ncbi:MAG: Nif11-like leader peptide family natural product precursor [Lentisphaeria bacterium]|nr:Nif11-like leader peptide family natural product precursor [Lentisphaeria bacterium]